MFHGSMVALVTPMNPDGSVDQPALARLVEFHIANGTDAIVAVGTTGESATLDYDEHLAVIKEVVTLVQERVPVIAGTGANCTREAIRLTQGALEAGADACLLVTPYYNKPTQQGLYLHYKAIAEAVAIPQILYNIPSRTGCDLRPETVAKLVDVPNIVGLKDGTGDMSRVQEMLGSCGTKLDLYSGDDATAREFIQLGGKGAISVTANVAPALMHRLCDAARRGDHATAAEIDNRLAALHRDLFCETNPIPVKWALSAMGLIAAGIRLPLTPLSPALHDRVRAALRQAGALP